MTPTRSGSGKDQSMRSLLSKVAVGGLLVFLVGLLVDPARIWPAFLVAAFFVLGMSLAGPLLLGMVALSAGRWADPLRRVPAAMGSVLPFAALLILMVAFGASTLYEWTHSGTLASHPLIAHKSGWLDLPFMLARTGLIFLVWAWSVRRLCIRSLEAPSLAAPSVKPAAAGFLVVFAPTFSIMAFDWLMSLEAEWFSTMYAVYVFSGLVLGGLAVVALLAVLQRRSGRLPGVSTDTLHDLGKLLFAFSFFWGYIWYSQYMLIWYSNIPEETFHFARRLTGSWSSLVILNLALNFAVPFVYLLPRVTKRSEKALVRVAVVLLVGRWLDLYLLVTPAFFPDPPLGVWELGTILGAAALVFLVTLQALERRRPEGQAAPSGATLPEPGWAGPASGCASGPAS